MKRRKEEGIKGGNKEREKGNNEGKGEMEEDRVKK